MILTKHFDQWISNFNLQLLIGSEKEISIAFSRWLLDKPMPELNTTCKFNQKKISVFSFINFITQKANKNIIKCLLFHIHHEVEIKHISEGCYWYIVSKTKKIRQFILTTYFPLLIYTQSIEAAAKDLTLCKISHRDEIAVTYIASIRSYFSLTTKQVMEEDDDFTNRK